MDPKNDSFEVWNVLLQGSIFRWIMLILFRGVPLDNLHFDRHFTWLPIPSQVHPYRRTSPWWLGGSGSKNGMPVFFGRSRDPMEAENIGIQPFLMWENIRLDGSFEIRRTPVDMAVLPSIYRVLYIPGGAYHHDCTTELHHTYKSYLINQIEHLYINVINWWVIIANHISHSWIFLKSVRGFQQDSYGGPVKTPLRSKGGAMKSWLIHRLKIAYEIIPI